MRNNYHNDATSEKYLKLLKKYRIIPKKELGQNFLVSNRILRRIIQFSRLKKGEEVLEIGPGLGFLTKELLEKKVKVVAVEIDRNLARILERRLGKNKNLKIIQENILKIKDYKQKIIGSIPYQITSPLIRKILTSKSKPKTAILLVQKEVAERIIAKPGSSNRGYLSVITQIFGEPEILFYVGRENFFPEPKVDSALLKLNIKEKEPKFDKEKLLRLVKFGFSQKRKKLRNSLSAGLHQKPKEIDKILNSLKIDTNLRAEDLSIKDWEKILFVVDKELI